MSKKIVVMIPQLKDSHKQKLAAASAAKGFDIVFCPDIASAIPALQDAEIALGNVAELAQNSPCLKWLCTTSAGVNQFTAPGLFASPEAILSNSSGAYGVTIAEHIVMVTLELMRHQNYYDNIVKNRKWGPSPAITSIKGSRITILGSGDLGQEAAIRLRAFSPETIVAVNRSGRNTSGLFDSVCTQDKLDEVLPCTDLLIITLPGTAETFHMMNADRIKLLPDGAIIVNVGRGTALDQTALEPHLRCGRLKAALDVFEQEPLPQENTLWECPNLLITPHISGKMTLPYTVDRIIDMFLEDFDNYCSGRPLRRLVHLSQGY